MIEYVLYIQAHAADCTGQNEETTAEEAGSVQQAGLHHNAIPLSLANPMGLK